ncbi:MAG: hypothetical protein WCA93_02200, partial [Acidimicrobiia bacterium]
GIQGPFVCPSPTYPTTETHSHAAEAPADRRLFGIWRTGVCLTEVITDVAQAGEQSPAREN